MKKLFTSLALMSATVVLSAQVLDSPAVLPSRNTNMMPAAYTASGASMLVLDSYNDDDYSSTFSIYDENLREVVTFATPVPPSFEVTYWTQSKVYGPIGIKARPNMTNEYPDLRGMSIDEALEFIRNNWGGEAAIKNVDGDRVIVPYPDYYYSEFFGETYPTRYLKNVDGAWQESYVEYSYEDWGPPDKWGEPEERTDRRTPQYPESMELVSDYGNDLDMEVTQTFFNDDDKFEYILPVCQVGNFTYEDDQNRSGGQRLEYRGFDVYTSDGSLVRQFRLPAGYVSEYLDASALTLGDINYVAIRADKDGEEYVLVYRADGASIAAAPALIQKASSVSPTAPQRGQTVHVDLGFEAKPGCSVSVVNAQGREVNRINVAEGNNAAEIRTDSFDRGVYVVVVKNGNKKQEVTKIVVR